MKTAMEDRDVRQQDGLETTCICLGYILSVFFRYARVFRHINIVKKLKNVLELLSTSIIVQFVKERIVILIEAKHRQISYQHVQK